MRSFACSGAVVGRTSEHGNVADPRLNNATSTVGAASVGEIDLTNWPQVDQEALSQQQRERFARRGRAIQLYLLGVSATRIRAECGIGCFQAYRLLTERCLALAASRAARHRQVLAACEGPCLTYSMLTGWEAKHGVPPVDAAMRRLRLLGLDGKRPHFWLYHAADGRFVARLCQSRLQALGSAPTTAIAALREAALDYVRRYGSPP